MQKNGDVLIFFEYSKADVFTQIPPCFYQYLITLLGYHSKTITCPYRKGETGFNLKLPWWYNGVSASYKLLRKLKLVLPKECPLMKNEDNK